MKTEYQKYRDIWIKTGVYGLITPFPTQIDTDTIDSCNLNCSICHEKGRKRTHAKIDVAAIKRSIDDGVGNGLYSINIGSVGEPYLNKKALFEIIDYAKKKGLLDIFVHTNFLLLDESDIRKTVDLGATCFCIAVDAINPETYRNIRGGDFEKLLKNIQYINNYKLSNKLTLPKIRISAVPCKDNEHELKEMKLFWGKYADIVEIQNYRYDPTHTSANICTKKIHGYCPSLWQRIMIFPNGDIAPCCCKEGLSSDLILGNIKTTYISEAWNSEKLNNIRKNMVSGQLNLLPTCQSCLNRTFVYG
jgi:MoaA/NifB/PqqE/SkfB family radical SAM enzyme